MAVNVDTSLRFVVVLLLVVYVDSEQKKCHEGRGKKKKSQQSLESVSKQATVTESMDTALPALPAAAAAAAAAAVDSNSTLVDSNVSASESVAHHHGPVIGLFVTGSLYSAQLVSKTVLMIVIYNYYCIQPEKTGWQPLWTTALALL